MILCPEVLDILFWFRQLNMFYKFYPSLILIKRKGILLQNILTKRAKITAFVIFHTQNFTAKLTFPPKNQAFVKYYKEHC